MRLRDLLDGVVDPVVVVAGSGPPDDAILDRVDIESVVADSRRAGPNALFACVVGARHDGHDHATDAVRSGAAAVLVERPLDLAAARNAGVAQILVPSVRCVLGPISSRLAGDPSRSLAVIGVTGTNGKTTVTHLLEAIGTAAGRPTAVLGTLGARWGGRTIAATFTTPEAPDLQREFAAMRDDGVDLAAVEVSSHAVAHHRIDGTTFAVLGFTNLSSEHLDLHGTMAEYFAAKAALFDPRFTTRAAVVIDDEWGRRLVADARAAGLDVSTVSRNDPAASVHAVELVTTAAGSRFVAIREGREPLRVSIALVGDFNVTNALLAIALADAVGLADEAIVLGLATVRAVPGRLEPVADPSGRSVFVDYAHTPEALATVLRTARALAPAGRVVLVFGCGGDRDRTKRPLMGQVAARLADVAVLTSDNPRSEDPAAIAAEVLAGLDAGDPGPVVELDRRAAITVALRSAAPGDVVLITGKGHETGQTAGGVTVPFDDRVVAASLVGEVEPCS